MNTFDEFDAGNSNNLTALRTAIKADLSSYLYKKTKRNPMILPVVAEI